MRFQWGVVLCLVLAAGCRDGTSPEAGLEKNSGEGGNHSLTGTVITLDMQPDSHYVSVAGVRLTLIRNGNGGGIDTTGVPPDSMAPLMSRHHPGIFTADTIPGDSVSLPPTGDCNAMADTVGTATTDDQGHFSFSGLTAGSYNLIAEPSDTHFGNLACGVDLTHHDTVDLQLFVATVTGGFNPD